MLPNKLTDPLSPAFAFFFFSPTFIECSSSYLEIYVVNAKAIFPSHCQPAHMWQPVKFGDHRCSGLRWWAYCQHPWSGQLKRHFLHLLLKRLTEAAVWGSAVSSTQPTALKFYLVQIYFECVVEYHRINWDVTGGPVKQFVNNSEPFQAAP